MKNSGIKFISLIILASLLLTAPRPVSVSSAVKSRAELAAEMNRRGDAPDARIMLTGDLMCLKGQQYDALNKGKYNFIPKFAKIRPIFMQADYVVGNLESLFSKSYKLTKDVNPEVDGKLPLLNGPTEYLEALRATGFDAFVTANNHCCDWGPKAIEETCDSLEKYGFSYTGTCRYEDSFAAAGPELGAPSKYILTDINGIKVAILSYTILINQRGKLTEDEMSNMVNRYYDGAVISDVALAKAEGAEFIIAYNHWGNENTTELIWSQTSAAQVMADAGVDLIVGSHSHCLQEYTELTASDGRKVHCRYSMGNFISSMVRDINNETVIMQVDLTRTEQGIEYEVNYLPVHVRAVSGYGSYTAVPDNKHVQKIFDVVKEEKRKPLFSERFFSFEIK